MNSAVYIFTRVFFFEIDFWFTRFGFVGCSRSDLL